MLSIEKIEINSYKWGFMKSHFGKIIGYRSYTIYNRDCLVGYNKNNVVIYLSL